MVACFRECLIIYKRRIGGFLTEYMKKTARIFLIGQFLNGWVMKCLLLVSGLLDNAVCVNGPDGFIGILEITEAVAEIRTGIGL